MSGLDDVRAERLRELALGYRIFAAFGWGDTGDGHISARDPERADCFWTLEAAVPFGRATVADLVLVGPDGELVDPQDDRRFNRTSWRIHWPIHEARPDVVAVAHTHTPWGTPFASERRLLEPIIQEACLFYDDHSLFDDEEVQVLSLDGGKRIAAALGSNRAVILANHGLLTTGASVGAAVAAFVTMERVCEAHLKAPGAKPVSPQSAQMAKDDMRPEISFERSFTRLVECHLD